jgi:simple sugar transport system ATP-binding protein
MPHSHRVVQCLAITKYFGGVQALHEVALELCAGEIVCLVGDNGAGKSTLVKILGGVHQPDSGEIRIGEQVVRGLTPREARAHGIEIVYQHLSLCDNLGAAANIMLGHEPVRFRVGPFGWIDIAQTHREADRRLADVGAVLEDLETPVRKLSGGQRQSIAIARAIGHSSRLILFDEPTAALGVRQTSATLNLIRQTATLGVAVVVVSHNLDDVFAVADRVVALRHGRVMLDAPLELTSREEVVACMTGLEFRNGGK